MDKLSAMRLLVHIVQTKSFARGAQAEGISTATATQRINNYERELGVKLLNRTTRGVSLTEQGEDCYNASMQILADLEQLEQKLTASHADAAGIVRINCNVGIGRSILLPALADFAKTFPAIKLHLVLSDTRAQFVRDKVDFSIRIGGLDDQDLVMRNLGCARRLIVASPDYVKCFGIPLAPADLIHHTLIDFLLPDTAEILPWEFKNYTQPLIANSFAINDAEARVQMAVQGLGIIQAPGFVCVPFLRAGKLVRLMQDFEVEVPAASLLYPRNRHLSRRVKIAMDFCTELISSNIASVGV